MILNWFDAKASVEMGVQLAEDLSAALDNVRKGSKKELENKEKAIERVFAQLQPFKQQHSLNFYKKAKLINAFKWHLLEHGQDKAFVEEVTKTLVFLMQ